MHAGSDPAKLTEGLARLKSCAAGLDRDLQLYGSILLPTKKMLAQFAFRPWSGVVLSREFLSSVSAADDIMLQILRVYAQNNVIPVFESAVVNDADLKRVHSLLDVYDREARSCGK